MKQEYSAKRFKMYKKGKIWVYASLTVASVLGMNYFSMTSVSADNQVVKTTKNDNSSVAVSNSASTSAGALTSNSANDNSKTAIVAGMELSESTSTEAKKINTSDTSKQGVNSTTQSTVTQSGETKKEVTTSQSSIESENINSVLKKANIDINSFTPDEIKLLNQIDFSNSAQAGTRLTYSDFRKIADTLVAQDGKYAVPFFDAKQIQNFPAAYTKDAQTNTVEHLDIWDSWPVQNPTTGQVSNWNGYQLVMAMMGVPNQNDNHVYLLYNKYGDNELSHWKNAGPIFGYNATAVSQEWSGSSLVNPDGSVQVFYTQVDTSDANLNHQKLATATLNLIEKDGEIVVDSVENNHILFEGDGYYYQSYNQWRATNRGADNIAMRDPHIIEDSDGSRYLAFEAATGVQNYQGYNQIFNWKNYGGDTAQNLKDFFRLLSDEDMKSRATWANAAIGLLKLSDNDKNPTVSELYTPLLTANMVSDEIERPDIIKIGDKYYLFADTRLNRGSNDDAWQKANLAVGDNVAMVGYVSDRLTGGYVPLNNSGVVLTSSVPANWRTATYSYYAVPVEGHSDRVLITSYMTNRNYVAGDGMNSTWAPSFLLQLNSDNTTTVLARTTKQGDWIWDDGSQDDSTMGTLDTSALPGEKEKPVDWDLIGYGLHPHTPVTPLIPIMPNVPPVTPNVPPITPNVPPITPDTPTNTPVIPGLPITDKDGKSVSALGLLVASLLGLVGVTRYRRMH
ncbi:glycoside hydrolase family 68 protein [Convivina praedatoris]|uniref:glycoside hydrolase family 68 protein n=1 Tax=Convivina praedatoris TaxID=2880963 RepID=UPI002010430E|nr:glycoside hydrolase family 68 protein [Convivina sp. LMG 32447]CAH1857337.1 Inulosucrase [Convivina sp. LMG 32447]